MDRSVDISRRTWLQRIQLVNFRCFEQLTIDFDQSLTVLIAKNGAGKTSVLDAIAASFGTFVGSFFTGKRSGIDNSDVRLLRTNSELNQMEPQYPAAILAKGKVDGEDTSWERWLNTPKSGTTIKEARPLTAIGERLQQSVTANEAVLLPLIAYYGTGRLWNQKKKTEKKVFESEFYSRTAGYQDCLDPASSYKFFVDWLRYAARADSDLRNQQRERLGPNYQEIDTPYSPLIQCIRNAVNECLEITGWSNLRWSFRTQSVVMHHPKHGDLEVDQLSDGVRNMIALVADIAYRMVRLNSNQGKEATKITPGLIMIDEVDMHLHPEWQQIVLKNLSRTFPSIQFIVTTHSPQVISTINSNYIRVLDENLDGQAVAAIPAFQTYGRSNAEVMGAVMGISPEPVIDETNLLRRYMEIIEQGDWLSTEANNLRSQLESALGSDHSALIRADMISRRREILGDAPIKGIGDAND